MDNILRNLRTNQVNPRTIVNILLYSVHHKLIYAILGTHKVNTLI